MPAEAARACVHPGEETHAARGETAQRGLSGDCSGSENEEAEQDFAKVGGEGGSRSRTGDGRCHCSQPS